MSLLTSIWLLIAAACLTLAAVHVHVLIRRRNAGNGAFALLALSLAVAALIELGAFHAASIDEYGRWLWWLHWPIWTGLFALVAFVHWHLRAGVAWLGWTAVALRTVAFAMNLSASPNLDYQRIISLEKYPLLGDSVSVVQGVPNPWQAVAQLSMLFLVAFLLTAMHDVLHRGERRRVWTIGAGMGFFVALGTAVAISYAWALLKFPMMMTLSFLPLVVGMCYELGLEVARSEQLSDILNATNSELQHLSRVATLGELSPALAHELNQPLAVIMSNAEAAQQLLRQPALDIEELSAILVDIVEADQRAGEVIQRLRELLKRRETTRQPLSINETVLGALHFMRSDLLRRGVSVELGLDERVPMVDADPVTIEQVLINLIRNACDAMVGNPARARALTINTSFDGHVVQLHLADRGCGLPAWPEQVFQPFYTTKPHGLGLGLAISRSIISAHGGRLWAENNIGRGATFHLGLPARSSAT